MMLVKLSRKAAADLLQRKRDAVSQILQEAEVSAPDGEANYYWTDRILRVLAKVK